MITILFFARVRDEAGTDELTMPIPQGVTRISQLTEWLRVDNEGRLAVALSVPNLLVSVNREITHGDVAIKDGDEIAYFPPVTGG